MGWQEAPVVESGSKWASAPEVSLGPLKRFDQAMDSGVKNIMAGAVKGAANIGSTLLRPLDALGVTGRTNKDRREGVTEALQTLGADTDSTAFKTGELGAEVAGTAGAGGAIAKIPMLVKYAPRLAAAIESGGFKLGGAPAKTAAETVKNAVTRTAGGAITGGASAGLVNPDDAATGAVVGGVMPGAVKVAGAAGKALSSEVSPEVAKLYGRAKDLGIDIPADRLVNSKPLNAVAASLNYVPFSGRAGTEERMVSQFNRAVSKTFGQDTPNLAQGIKRAEQSLGDKFENTLRNNTVKVDHQFINDMTANLGKAQNELSESEAKIIGNQIDAIIAKAGQSGEIDGQAAYNIKKTLDRIANRNSNEAYYARELRDSLFGALNRSLGKTEADQFALLRKAYGNMLEVKDMVKHGAEAGVSPAAMANKTNLRSKELNELADIAAQFLKTRENPHGALQRLVIGSSAASLAHGVGAMPYVAAAVPVARGTNAALNSNAVKELLLNPQAAGRTAREIAANKPLRALVYDQANRGSP